MSYQKEKRRVRVSTLAVEWIEIALVYVYTSAISNVSTLAVEWIEMM